ncbi:hypothetical protein EE612_031963 [Oryza sativa]|nr:hypothetical protein EE612_031963 [Oryza sativa]
MQKSKRGLTILQTAPFGLPPCTPSSFLLTSTLTKKKKKRGERGGEEKKRRSPHGLRSDFRYVQQTYISSLPWPRKRPLRADWGRSVIIYCNTKGN